MSNNIRMSCFSNPYSSMSPMSMSNNIRMSCFSLVRNLHDSTTIVTISSILDMLNPTIRKSYLILSNNIPVLVTRPVLTEVCVILVIMHSVFKLEWVRLFMIISTMASYNSTSMSSNKSSSDCPPPIPPTPAGLAIAEAPTDTKREIVSFMIVVSQHLADDSRLHVLQQVPQHVLLQFP